MAGKGMRLTVMSMILLLYMISARTSRAITLPNVTDSGYLAVNKKDGSKIFYSYYEAIEAVDETTPVLLWLQGGPGCAGHFGNLYELGPQRVNESLELVENPGAWNRKAGLLFVDQPVGTGFSISGEERIPADEIEIAADLYVALQDFFHKHRSLQKRPFVISGESYAGKYVPSIGHFILQMNRLFGILPSEPQQPLNASLPPDATGLGSPKFKLRGLVIGNGLTDPISQVQVHASTAFFQGLIDTQQRVSVLAMQLQVSQAIAVGDWALASRRRETLLGFLQEAIGAGTLLDYRRTYDYDSHKSVDRYLNKPEVKEHLGADKDVEFVSCSEEVGRVLGADVMKSVKHLIPDLLASYPLLLYQGAFDAQDGPASAEAWVHSLDWPGRRSFSAAPRRIWRANPDGSVPGFGALEGPTSKGAGLEKDVGRVIGYWRQAGPLSHVVIRNAGHMVPHDDPLAAQAMIETWLKGEVVGGEEGWESRAEDV